MLQKLTKKIKPNFQRFLPFLDFQSGFAYLSIFHETNYLDHFLDGGGLVGPSSYLPVILDRDSSGFTDDT
jgi:hypothetical protein